AARVYAASAMASVTRRDEHTRAAGALLRTAASLRARRDVPDWVVRRERAYDPAGSSISELEYGADCTHANGLTVDVSGAAAGLGQARRTGWTEAGGGM